MRIVVDLDYPSVPEVVYAWTRIQRHGDGVPHGRVSSSGEGVHIKVHGYFGDDVNELRRRLGTDELAVLYDERGGPDPKQVAFSGKGDKKAGEWTNELNELLAQLKQW